jgi:hypothetical protein
LHAGADLCRSHPPAPVRGLADQRIRCAMNAGLRTRSSCPVCWRRQGRRLEAPSSSRRAGWSRAGEPPEAGAAPSLLPRQQREGGCRPRLACSRRRTSLRGDGASQHGLVLRASAGSRGTTSRQFGDQAAPIPGHLANSAYVQSATIFPSLHESTAQNGRLHPSPWSGSRSTASTTRTSPQR